MPSVLGLTTDESPHGIQSNDDRQLATQGSVQGEAHGQVSRRFQSEKGEGQLTAQGSAKGQGWGSLTASANKDSNGSSSGKKNKANTISARNHKAAKENESLFWRAVCDQEEPEGVLEYLADSCAIVSPLLFGKKEAVEGKDDVKKALEDGQPWTSYKISDVQTVELALMAVGCIYRITLTKDDGEQAECMATSTWTQSAGADWFLCGHLIARIG